MTAEKTFVVRGVPRRTILKTAAWSVPVVAVAAATPLASASTVADLQLTAQPFGETFQAFSADGQQGYEIGIIGGYNAGTLGTTDTPAGSTFVMSFDSRVFQTPALTAGGTNVPVTSSTTTGDVTTAMFVLPVAVPANGGSLSLRPSLAGVGSAPQFYPDVHPNTVDLLPPSGTTDPNPGNNTYSMAATYFLPNDATITATWDTGTVPLDAGGTTNVAVLTGASLSAQTPGPVSSGSVAYIVPQMAYPISGTGPGRPVYSAVAITSALLNGVDVLAQVTQPVGDGTGFRIEIDTAIPAGQVLVLALSTTVDQTPAGYVQPGGYVHFSASRDRDTSNNSAYAPAV